MVANASTLFAEFINPLVSEIYPGCAVVVQGKETSRNEWLGEVNNYPSAEVRLVGKTLTIVIYDIHIANMVEDPDCPFCIQELPW